MIERHKLDSMLAVILFLSLLLYHLLDVIEPTSSLSRLWQVARFGIVFFSFFGMIYKVIPWICQKFFKDIYIGGRYEGFSIKHIYGKKDETYKDKEIFTISQNLFYTTIEGSSERQHGEYKTSWHGRLLRKEENTYYFGIELTVSSTKFGIVTLTFQDNTAKGSFFPVEEQHSKSYTICTAKVPSDNKKIHRIKKDFICQNNSIDSR